MMTHDYFKAEWLALDPEVLERLIPIRHGHVHIEDIEAVSRSTEPLLEQAWTVCAYGITCSEDGIPLRDWRRFLGTLRWRREQAQQASLQDKKQGHS